VDVPSLFIFYPLSWLPLLPRRGEKAEENEGKKREEKREKKRRGGRYTLKRERSTRITYTIFHLSSQGGRKEERGGGKERKIGYHRTR